MENLGHKIGGAVYWFLVIYIAGAGTLSIIREVFDI